MPNAAGSSASKIDPRRVSRASGRKLPPFAAPVGSVAFLKIICAAIIDASWQRFAENGPLSGLSRRSTTKESPEISTATL